MYDLNDFDYTKRAQEHPDECLDVRATHTTCLSKEFIIYLFHSARDLTYYFGTLCGYVGWQSGDSVDR